VDAQVVPVAEAYCTDQPVTSTAVVDRLATSMKSRSNAPPELPPPPYTSLTTRFGETANAADGNPTTAPVPTRAKAAMPPLIDFVAGRTSSSLSSVTQKQPLVTAWTTVAVRPIRGNYPPVTIE